MIWILILLGGVIMIFRLFSKIRKEIISQKVKPTNLSKEEEDELWILANKCLDRAENEGIIIPHNKKIIVCRLDEDPYTWVIVKLGLKDKELYRTRMSIQDVADARLKLEMKNKEGN